LTITTNNASSPFGFLSPITPTSFPGISECQTAPTFTTTSITSNVALASGASCQIGTAIDATSAGTYTGTATTTDNSLLAPGTVHTMYLTGTDTGVTITMSSNPTSPYAGAPTQLTATLVNGTTPVTSGTVTFYLGTSTSGTLLGSGTLDPVLGTVTISTSALTSGTDNIFITYPGATGVNPLFVAAATTVQLVVAAKPVPTITITANPTAINAGSATTLTATVTATGTPTGTVTISYKLGTGTLTQICQTTNLAANGVFSCAPTTLPAGTDTISATYGGDNNFASASTTTSATVVVTALPTTTTLTALPATPNLGQQVTLTATVSGLLTSPPLTGGTVSFKDTFTPVTGTGATYTYGPVAVNTTTGQAVYTSTTLAAGTHVIVATFSNDSYYGTSASSSATVTVITPSFTVTLVSANGVAVPVTTPATTFAGIAVPAGSDGSVVFTVQSVGGYAGTVTPACDLNGAAAGGVSYTALPSTMGCIYSPANFVISTNTTSTETILITTEQLSGANRTNRTMNPILAVFLLPGAGLALFGMRRRAALKQWQRLALLVLIFVGGALAVGGLSGCGGGLNEAVTAKNSYLLPITFSDGTTTYAFQITVTVTGH